MTNSITDTSVTQLWTNERKKEFIEYIRKETDNLESQFLEENPLLNDIALTEFLLLVIKKSNKVTPFDRHLEIEEKGFLDNLEEFRSWLTDNRIV